MCLTIGKNPGKFENEPCFTRWANEFARDNPLFVTEGDGFVGAILLEGTTCKELNEVEEPICDECKTDLLALDSYAVIIEEDSQGFVTGSLVTKAQFSDIESDCQKEQTLYDGPQDGDLEVVERGDTIEVWECGKKTRVPALITTPENRNKDIRAFMELVRFWPNVWQVSDHGNAILIDVTKED